MWYETYSLSPIRFQLHQDYNKRVSAWCYSILNNSPVLANLLLLSRCLYFLICNNNTCLIGWCEVQNRYVKSAQLSSWHRKQPMSAHGILLYAYSCIRFRKAGFTGPPAFKQHALDPRITFQSSDTRWIQTPSSTMAVLEHVSIQGLTIL